MLFLFISKDALNHKGIAAMSWVCGIDGLGVNPGSASFCISLFLSSVK